MWSGPRNLSTALMRAFEARADCEVWDEPFYAAYLAETGLDHPMADEVVEAGIRDPREVAELCASQGGAALRYQKHMTHHMLPGFPLGWAASVRNAFLIRDPARVVASYDDRRAAPTAADLGYERQLALFAELETLQGTPPPVIDADDLRRNPEATLCLLCEALGVGFDPAMLSWLPGPRASDGVWGRHWYASVEASTGFAPPGEPSHVPDRLRAVEAACRRWYEPLAERRLVA